MIRTVSNLHYGECVCVCVMRQCVSYAARTSKGVRCSGLLSDIVQPITGMLGCVSGDQVVSLCDVRFLMAVYIHIQLYS